MGMDAQVVLPGETVAASLSNSASTGAPLPLLGLRGTWRLADKWQASARIQYFKLSFDDYNGNILDYRADLSWMPCLHFGLGIGYNRFRFKVAVDGPQFEGDLAWRYSGATAFVKAVF